MLNATLPNEELDTFCQCARLLIVPLSEAGNFRVALNGKDLSVEIEYAELISLSTWFVLHLPSIL